MKQSDNDDGDDDIVMIIVDYGDCVTIIQF